jgi:hypothetical protein
MKPNLRGQSTFHATEYLPQDMVTGSQEGKCGLKYVIQSPGDQPGLWMNTLTLSNEIMQVMDTL